MVADHPVIREAERYGDTEDRFPVCPVCGKETDTFYKNEYGEIVGCDNCVNRVDAWGEIEI